MPIDRVSTPMQMALQSACQKSPELPDHEYTTPTPIQKLVEELQRQTVIELSDLDSCFLISSTTVSMIVTCKWKAFGVKLSFRVYPSCKSWQVLAKELTEASSEIGELCRNFANQPL